VPGYMKSEIDTFLLFLYQHLLTFI